MAKKASPKKTLKKARKADKKVASKPSKLAARAASRPALRVQESTPQEVVKLKKSPLSKAEITEFRKMLLEKRRSLIGDMNGMQTEALRTNRQDGSGDLSLMPDHPANIATDNFEQEFTLGLLESERTLLKEINEALERIQAGTFGMCLGTGEPISKPRLVARPWAKYGIEYARMIEKGLIRPGEDRYGMAASEEEPAAPDEDEEDFEEEPSDSEE